MAERKYGAGSRLQTHPWHDLSSGARAPEEIAVVVETPANSRNKYELDKTTGLFKLDRVLHSSVHYPGDYGFIPRTLFDDGDPIDVLLLMKEPSFTGCMVSARPLGVLRMLDVLAPDDKILAAPTHDPYFDEYLDLQDLPAHVLKEIEYFFATYKELEGRTVRLKEWQPRAAAFETITRSIARYRTEFLDVSSP
jgi:inorganic pyrophosphatase